MVAKTSFSGYMGIEMDTNSSVTRAQDSILVNSVLAERFSGKAASAEQKNDNQEIQDSAVISDEARARIEQEREAPPEQKEEKPPVKEVSYKSNLFDSNNIVSMLSGQSSSGSYANVVIKNYQQ